MADLTLPEWNRLIEVVVFDFAAWDGPKVGFVNSAADWATTADGDEEPTDLLDLQTFVWDGLVCRVIPYKTSGWRHGGESIARPSITIADVGGQLFNMLRSYGGAHLAPVQHFLVLAEDAEADNGVIVGNPRNYLVNKVTGNGMSLTIELAGHTDGPRSKFPPYSMTEADAPGLRNRYDRR